VTSPRDEALRLVREGHDLHYGADAPDPDLALLDGDRLYAAGLERLAQSGDLEAIRALADLISECARAAAEGDPEASAASWRATARQMGVTDFTPS
jgi:hypothetical protein